MTKLNDGDSIPDLIIQSYSGKDKGRTSVLHGNGEIVRDDRGAHGLE